MKEITQDKQKDILYLWIRNNVLRHLTLPNLIYRLNAIFIKIQLPFLQKLIC